MFSALQGGEYKRMMRKDFDFLIGYNAYNDMAYVYSFDEIKHLKSTVSITDEAKEAWHKMRL